MKINDIEKLTCWLIVVEIMGNGKVFWYTTHTRLSPYHSCLKYLMDHIFIPNDMLLVNNCESPRTNS